MTHPYPVSQSPAFQVLQALFSLREEGVATDVLALSAYLSFPVADVRGHLLHLELIGLANAGAASLTMRGLVVAASMRRQSRQLAA